MLSSAAAALLLLFSVAHAQDFGYDGANGPQHWGEHYGSCFGKHQSPININLLTVKDVRLPPLHMEGFSEKLEALTLSNNGHTVMIRVEPPRSPPIIKGGPLKGDYVFSQLHFHWGHNDSIGSEDRINSKSFPMELHIVFFKKEYGDPKGALDHSDGLAVLAFFYELDRHPNPSYYAITNSLGNVTEPQTTVPINTPLSLISLLPYDLQHYFTYSGSLTTPPCSEVVTWIDYEQPIRLSHDQINGFRELRSDHGKITHNFRPLQPLGDRTVYYNTDREGYFDNTIDKPPRFGSNKKKNDSNCMKPIFTTTLLASLLVFLIS